MDMFLSIVGCYFMFFLDPSEMQIYSKNAFIFGRRSYEILCAYLLHAYEDCKKWHSFSKRQL